MRNQMIALAIAGVIGGASAFTYAEDTMGDKVEKAVEKVVTDKNEGANDATKAPKLPAGIQAKENNDFDDIRSSLITIVNRVMTKDNFDDAVGYLANQDRDRVNAQLGDTYKNLEGKVEELRGAFKQKYNEDFELKSGVLNMVTSIQQGEVQDPATARAHWPLPVMMMKDGETRKVSDEKAAAPDVDPKFEEGRDVAVVRLEGKDGKSLALSMQYELPDYWVLDVPNSVNAETIVKHQTEVVQKILDMRAEWPENKDDAYRAIAFKIIKGFYGESKDGQDVANMPRD